MSEPLKAVVVDDEPLARDSLRLLIDRDHDFVVVGEASGAGAADLVRRTRPDVMFLDIQMPEVDGFGVIEAIGADKLPLIVFTTAYDEYALKAFEVQALDYLLKPFDDARFAQTLERVKARLRSGERGDADLERLAAVLAGSGRYARRLLVRVREKVVVVNVDEIDWIEAADYYVSIHAGGHAHLLRETLNELEVRLDPARFCRVHRSAIVNVDRVREIHPLFRGDSTLVLADGTRVKLSRTRREQFDRLFTASGSLQR